MVTVIVSYLLFQPYPYQFQGFSLCCIVLSTLKKFVLLSWQMKKCIIFRQMTPIKYIKFLQEMESIFQIKINENKLQTILNQFQAAQQQQSIKIAQLQELYDKLREEQAEKQIKLIDSFDQKLSSMRKESSQALQVQAEEYGKKLQIQGEVWTCKISGLSQHIRDVEEELEEKVMQLDKHELAFEEVHEKCEIFNKKLSDNEEGYLLVSNKLEKSTPSSNFMNSEDFHHFIQLLIDKEMGHKIPQFQKEYKNPFEGLNDEQKRKRFKKLKEQILQTQKQVKRVNSNLGNLKVMTEEEVRSNREETHLHYAFLSSKLKQLQSKYEVQNNFIKSKFPQTSPIIYPSNHPKYQSKKSGSRFSSLAVNNYEQFLNNINLQGLTISSKEQEERTIREHKNSQIVNSLQEKFDIMSKKLVKIQNQIQSVAIQMQEKKKMLQKGKNFKRESEVSLNNAVSHFAFREFEDKLEDQLNKKVSLSAFQAEIKDLKAKLNIQTSIFTEKANRQETRQAFVFIQGKIKEIVTILAEMQSSSKKTVAGRKTFQCISCDDNFFEQFNVNVNSGRKTPKMTVKTARSSTNIHRRAASNRIGTSKQNNIQLVAKNNEPQ